MNVLFCFIKYFFRLRHIQIDMFSGFWPIPNISYISGVMARVFVSSAVGRGFKLRTSEIKYYELDNIHQNLLNRCRSSTNGG